MKKIVCISDTHDKNLLTKWNIPDGDILIHAGDMTAKGSNESIKKVSRELLALSHRYKIVVAGNHDRAFWGGKGYSDAWRLMSGIIVLQDEAIEILGLRIYGSSWLKFEGGKYPFEIVKLSEMWKLIPSDLDILITHMPPKGIMDLNGAGEHAGSPSLTVEVTERVRPRLHVFGHMHRSYGKLERNGTIFVNASLVDNERKPANEPIVIKL